MIFKEDSHKVLNKNAAINLNVLRKITLAIMKKWTPNTRKEKKCSAKTCLIIYGSSKIFTNHTKNMKNKTVYPFREG
ncbi:hypothetical protein [Bacillus cereus]|uniref:hypothetical protein n=1 Tax=Bacillus cereus TaxID=1396 RepID=UPI00197AF5C7|nr:hypothetical protein [Bacillus cereus]